jgi:hypothetical protein
VAVDSEGVELPNGEAGAVAIVSTTTAHISRFDGFQPGEAMAVVGELLFAVQDALLGWLILAHYLFSSLV